MTLKDHFAKPLVIDRPWEGFHSHWAVEIAKELNRELPGGFVAIAQTHRGPIAEIDVAAYQEANAVHGSRSGWQPEKPDSVFGIDWPERDHFEIRIFNERKGSRPLVGAIELVSPANKDRPSERQAFAGKCAGYLRMGIGLIVVDVVTNRHQSLHGHLLELLELEPSMPSTLADDDSLYAIAYRTDWDESGRNDPSRLEIWARALTIGGELPTLPLWLAGEIAVPVELGKSYTAACESLRIE